LSDPLNTSQFDASRTASDDKARHLLKCMFPVEYKLVDSLEKLAYTKGVRKKEDLELLIKVNKGLRVLLSSNATMQSRNSQKTPNRLKKALALVKHLIQLHVRCRYRRMLNICCPSKVCQLGFLFIPEVEPFYSLIANEAKALTKALYWSGPIHIFRFVCNIFLQEMMSEVHTISQLSLDTSNLTFSGPINSTKTTSAKPKFAEFICTHGEV
jgi:hypothetical protein